MKLLFLMISVFLLEVAVSWRDNPYKKSHKKLTYYDQPLQWDDALEELAKTTCRQILSSKLSCDEAEKRKGVVCKEIPEDAKKTGKSIKNWYSKTLAPLSATIAEDVSSSDTIYFGCFGIFKKGPLGYSCCEYSNEEKQDKEDGIEMEKRKGKKDKKDKKKTKKKDERKGKEEKIEEEEETEEIQEEEKEEESEGGLFNGIRRPNRANIFAGAHKNVNYFIAKQLNWDKGLRQKAENLVWKLYEEKKTCAEAEEIEGLICASFEELGLNEEEDVPIMAKMTAELATKIAPKDTTHLGCATDYGFDDEVFAICYYKSLGVDTSAEVEPTTRIWTEWETIPTMEQ